MPACGLPSALSAHPASIATSINLPFFWFLYSALAVETVASHCLEAQSGQSVPIFGEPLMGWSERTRRLASAVHLANELIYSSAEAHAEQQGMGATLSAAWIDGERMSVAHVGDSRVYLLRAGDLLQLTSDHSLVAEQVRRGILTPSEAEQSEMQSVLLRALGTQPEVEIETDEQALIPLDILLLCSDGLTRMVTEPEIAGTLQAETDPQKAAEKLVELANENGGADNITVIVLRVEPKPIGLLTWLRGSWRKTGSNGSSRGGG